VYVRKIGYKTLCPKAETGVERVREGIGRDKGLSCGERIFFGVKAEEKISQKKKSGLDNGIR